MSAALAILERCQKRVALRPQKLFRPEHSTVAYTLLALKWEGTGARGQWTQPLPLLATSGCVAFRSTSWRAVCRRASAAAA